MAGVTHLARLRRLARILGYPSAADLPLDSATYHKGRWWLSGPEGDQPLPCTHGCRTLPEALTSAEAWLSSEIWSDDI